MTNRLKPNIDTTKQLKNLTVEEYLQFLQYIFDMLDEIQQTQLNKLGYKKYETR